MALTKNLGDLEDKVTGKKLSNLVNEIKKIISFEDIPCFIMGYLACKDKTFGEACDYMGDELGISKNNVKEVELKREMSDLGNYFLENALEFNACNGETVIVKAEGFEKLERLQVDWPTFMMDQGRAAHDYDQEVIEKQKKTYKDLKKKVLVITHIGYSRGKDGFEKAATSAEQSQFKHFMYEFE